MIPRYGVQVYGVEASDMADIARTLVAANQLDDTITIIKGKAEEIELPEKVYSRNPGPVTTLCCPHKAFTDLDCFKKVKISC